MSRVRRALFRSPLAVVSSLTLAIAALHCGSPPSPPATPTSEVAPASAAATPKAVPNAAADAPPAAASASSPAAKAPLVVSKGCLAKEAVAGDVQARLKDAWRAAHLLDGEHAELENEGSRKLTTRPLADLDGDGTEELTLADDGTGNYNQLTFLYVSNEGCWKFSHVTLTTAYQVSKTAPKKGGRDLSVVQKASSCNDPKDRDAYVVTTLRASEAGWTTVRTTKCPCAGPKATKPSGDCAFELP